MKKYLVSISARGACSSIAFYTDTPTKNYRVYYNGSDSGLRFERLGNASRHLERLAQYWQYNGIAAIKREYAAKNEIPRRGSNA
jgi:hypothetical protein